MLLLRSCRVLFFKHKEISKQKRNGAHTRVGTYPFARQTCRFCNYYIIQSAKVNRKKKKQKSIKKEKAKINLITHTSSFYGEPTMPLLHNPNRSKPSKKPSRFSVPVWEHNSFLKDPAKGIRKMGKADRAAIRKFNRKYEKRKNK